MGHRATITDQSQKGAENNPNSAKCLQLKRDVFVASVEHAMFSY